MENFLRVLIGALTLGVSEIIKAVQDNKKCPYDYVYQRKGKTSCCKWRKRCALWTRCAEDIESCRQAHANYEANGEPCK